MKGLFYTSKRLALSSCLVVENESPQGVREPAATRPREAVISISK